MLMDVPQKQDVTIHHVVKPVEMLPVTAPVKKGGKTYAH